MSKTNIEWTEVTWNPTTGCDKVSAGCRECYAEGLSKRLKAMGSPKYANGFDLTLHPNELEAPYRWTKPRTVFVNSMSDLFHEAVPDSFIGQVFDAMIDNPRHTFQILTKRADRLRQLAPDLVWTPNIWMGVSVEDNRQFGRVEALRAAEGPLVKFLSCEPLIGPLTGLDYGGIDWVIAGGESGHNPRPMEADWVREIRDDCQKSGTHFFFKQWGGKNKKAAGRLLDGQLYSAMPERPLAV